MRKRLIYSLALLFVLFSLGAGLTMVYIYRVTTNLQSVIDLHRVEIIRQNLVINAQVVQANLYTTGTVFGKELDVIVDNVTALDESARGCLNCHHSKGMTARLHEVENTVEQYKEAISYLITTTANPERVERLKMVAVGIGDSLLTKTQEMAFIADKSLAAKTVEALNEINNSKIILIATLVLALFIALLIAIVLTKQITTPVYELVNAARMIASGHLGYKTSYHDKTEFGELAGSFNAMSTALKGEREKIDRYIEQLSGLYNITLSFYKIADMEDAYKEICRHVADLVKVRQCILILYDDTKQLFVPRTSAYGLDEDAVRILSFSRPKMEELFKFSNGLPIISNDSGNHGRFEPMISDALREKTLLVAWLHRKGKILGAIRVADKEESFTDDDAKLLTILANHMAVAMENAQLYSSLQDQMSELRDTQEQLIQSAKLAAIGELASNVAHEINNPLTSIIGFTELIKDEGDINIIKNRLDIIEKESMRARDIVRELLHFARKRPLQLTALNMNEALKDVIPLVESQARMNHVELVEEYGELPETVGDPNQLKQVFINIINNAIFAMTEGGKLTLSTSLQGEYIIIKFKDSGHGIPEDVLRRIFEPFYTTKKDKGTGLGLSISYRIVQEHGGRIDVESSEGQGTTFTIRIPVRTPS
ncbi:MAG: ATP-binding protein [Nitrospirae bacterium]|nr:ATP-binding protein [Nitrospirota bacterium]MCL5421012.1 ATP-binding protein [Nitrospirota bacterium]